MLALEKARIWGVDRRVANATDRIFIVISDKEEAIMFMGRTMQLTSCYGSEAATMQHHHCSEARSRCVVLQCAGVATMA